MILKNYWVLNNIINKVVANSIICADGTYLTFSTSNPPRIIGTTSTAVKVSSEDVVGVDSDVSSGSGIYVVGGGQHTTYNR